MHVAIVGSGLMARTHARALHGLGQSIACVVNPNEESARAFATEIGAESALPDLESALDSDIDVVHVCIPLSLHFEIARAALKAGKHVICEKPLCLDPAQARELTDLAKAENLVAAVVFNVRYHEACLAARDMIRKDCFGPIRLIHGSYLQEFNTLPDFYSWRYKPPLAGPMRATTEIGSHWIDLARFLTGLEITEVSAEFGRFSPERILKDGLMYDAHDTSPESAGERIEVRSEDAAAISLRFSNGAMGNLLLSEVSHGRGNSLSIDVTGGGESLWWNSEEAGRLNSGRKGLGCSSLNYPFSGGYPETFLKLFADVYRDVEQRKRGGSGERETLAYPSFEDGAINAGICDAIYKSAERNAAWVRPTGSEGADPMVARLIDYFHFEKLPAEGCLYRSSYRSALKGADGGPAATAILGLYCENPPSFSSFHCLSYDEVWHVYGGDPFILVLLRPDGGSEDVLMGSDPFLGQHLQFVVPAGWWQGGYLLPGGRYALFGCTMAPGFTEACFEGGVPEELIRVYPERGADIRHLSRVVKA